MRTRLFDFIKSWILPWENRTTSQSSNLLILPHEIIQHIMRYLSQKSLKTLNLTSTLFHAISTKELWYEPKLSRKFSLDNLRAVSHLPIQVLEAGWFIKLKENYYENRDGYDAEILAKKNGLLRFTRKYQHSGV